MARVTIDVIHPGFLTTVQDLGRAGFRQSGVSPGGALDSLSARVANLLAGNDEGAAVLEITLGALRLRFGESRVVVWCGGDFEVQAAGIRLPPGRACLIREGKEISFGGSRSGCRAWLAISGGIDVPEILGSRSTDLRAGFGGMEGRSLRAGDRLPVGLMSTNGMAMTAELASRRLANWGAPARWASPAQAHPVLRIVRGADWARFNPADVESFLRERFVVTQDCDRMGVRLDGPELRRVDSGADLISEPIAPGTIQVPSHGRPIVLLADCQTVGGYPKIAHVITVDQPIAAQLLPGDRVRFAEVSLQEAHRLLRERTEELERFKTGVRLYQR